MEVLYRGRLADGTRAHEVLGFVPARTTPQVIDRLFAWESVVRITKDQDPTSVEVA